MMKILVVGGPVENYIDKCLGSIKDQNYHDYEVQVILDPYEDKSVEKASKWVSEKIHLHVNKEQKFAISNLLLSAKMLNPVDDDILITIDADDWLASKDVFSIINRYYQENPNLLLTHGSWIPYPNINANTNNAPYSRYDFNTNIRKKDWRASHLRTFKYILWRNIKDEDLRDEHGQYYQSAWDLALMWPMLEMATYDRVKFVHELLYVYNMDNPASDTRLRLYQQMYYTNYLSQKTPYKPL